MSIFNSIKVRKPKLSKFDLSQERKLSLNMGKLYPILVQEVIPGDKFKVNSEIFMRMAPMVAPPMHRINVQTHYFFVPNRLVWDEWEDFITGGEDGEAQPAYPFANIAQSVHEQWREKRLGDYFGIPPSVEGEIIEGSTQISMLPFKAYALIYNEYFRDQNLEDKIEFTKTSGGIENDELTRLTTVRKRAWEKDYFTSCLPWSQLSGEAAIPLDVTPIYKDVSDVRRLDGANPEDDDVLRTNPGGQLTTGSTERELSRIENLQEMTGEMLINDLRKANKLQEWLEKSARGGSRYIEAILSHFGVMSKDSRLQRPEYLGGGRAPVTFSEVLQTSQTITEDEQGSEASQLGTMAGHGIAVGAKNGFKRSFTEHGFIIGLMSVLPKTAYQQGIDRKYSKFDKFDYYWPEFANLGEQEVLNKEIYLNLASDADNELTFGYQQRYAEYKYNPSTVHGDFRQEQLEFWHMGRIFDEAPALNSDFIQSDPSTRIFAIDDGELPEEEQVDKLYAQIYNSISALRPMPYHSIPSL